ncbi:conserved hypothetical protein [Vibrio chagasii]|nr:conserved hypothetical protein [Vibrio chagasii]
MKNDSKRMKRLNALYFVVAGALSVTFLSGCNSDKATGPEDGAVGGQGGQGTYLSSIVVQGFDDGLPIDASVLTKPVGIAQGVRVLAKYGNGTSRDITEAVDWNIDDSLNFDSGYIVGSQSGQYDISAVYKDDFDSNVVSFFVSDAIAESISFSSHNDTIYVGEEVRNHISAVFSDGETHDVTHNVNWLSSDRDVIRTLGDGYVEGQAIGRASISASLDTLVTKPKFTNVHGVHSIDISGLVGNASDGEAELLISTTMKMSAMGNFSDGVRQDLTHKGQWTSSNPSAVMVSDGTSFGVGVGTSNLTFSYGNVVSKPIVVSVVDASVTDLELSHSNNEPLYRGQKLHLSASARFNDESERDVTPFVNWNMSEEGVIELLQDGEFIAISEGTVRISGALDGVDSHNEIEASVTPVPLKELRISDADGNDLNGQILTMHYKEQHKVSLLAEFEDGEVIDLTRSAVFKSDNTRILVSDAGVITADRVNETGMITVVIPDLYQVDDSNVQFYVNVSPAEIVAAHLNSSTQNVGSNHAKFYSVTLSYEDGSVKTATQDFRDEYVTFTSSNSSYDIKDGLYFPTSNSTAGRTVRAGLNVDNKFFDYDTFSTSPDLDTRLSLCVDSEGNYRGENDGGSAACLPTEKIDGRTFFMVGYGTLTANAGFRSNTNHDVWAYHGGLLSGSKGYSGVVVKLDDNGTLINQAQGLCDAMNVHRPDGISGWRPLNSDDMDALIASNTIDDNNWTFEGTSNFTSGLGEEVDDGKFEVTNLITGVKSIVEVTTDRIPDLLAMCVRGS